MTCIEISSDKERADKEPAGSSSSHTEWKGKLAACLDGIETAGDFAGSKTYSAFVNPGLEVAGSPIPLPLTRHDAETLRGACRQAPYGKGEDTFVDESVPKTWELNGDQFSLANPDWDDFVRTLVRDVVHPLGIASVRADPYKLLLYEEGSFFTKHRDSEKTPGMIGTLVICLPAKHEGGDVRLSHAGRERVFATSQSSAFNLTALSWFSDVTHEIVQVTSGYRLVLTYNLIQTSDSGPSSAGTFAKQQEELQQLISEWDSKYPNTQRLLYCLEHKYTKSSLSLGSLKGRDQAVCQTLYNTCLENGLYLLLVNLTYYEEDEEMEEDAKLSMDSVCSHTGAQITTSVDVNTEEIMGKNPCEQREPDSVSGGGYTGNEGMTSIQLDDHTAAMIVSKQYVLELLIHHHGDYSALHSVLQHDLVNNDADRITRAFVARYITHLIKWPRGVKRWVFPDIYRWSVNQKLGHLSRKVIQASVTSSETDEVIFVIAEFINTAFKGTSSPQPDCDFWLGEYLSSVKALSNLTSILHNFEQSLADDAVKESFKSWQTSAEGHKLEAKESFDLCDQDFIMKIMITHSADLEWIYSNLIPKMFNLGSKSLLYILIGLLSKSVPEKAFPQSSIVAKSLFEASSEKLDLELSDFFSPNYVNTAQFPRAFIRFLDNCLKEGLTEQVATLLDSTTSRLVYSAKRRKSSPNFPEVESVQEFLQALANVLQEHGVPPRPSVGDLFETLIRKYVIFNVPAYPRRLPGWQYKPRGCGSCIACSDLDRFLGAENEREGRFRITGEKRTHVEKQLKRCFGLLSCTTERGSMPFTLIVRKAGEGKEYEAEFNQYQSRLPRYKEKTKPVQHDYVRQLLGESRYRALVLLEPPQDSEAGQQLAEHGKRKADDSAEDPNAGKKLRGI